MLRQIWELLKEMAIIFFGKGDDEVAKKTATIAILYRLVQWGLFGITISAITTGRVLKPEWGLMHFFLPLWIANIFIVGIILKVRSKTSIDFTLMEATRSVLGRAFKLSVVAGIILEAFSFLILLAYSGADQFYIFFEQRLPSMFSKIAVVVFASFCNMFIWVSIIYVGASGLIAFVKMLY